MSGDAPRTGIRPENLPIDAGARAERERWETRIAAAGPKRAYTEFKQYYATRGFRAQHSRSHLFGELLYRAGGADAITICDPSFGDFGCEHGFTVAAIAGRGVHAIAEINDACIRTLKTNQFVTSCQHGIGHGILEYLGRDRLLDALEVCPPPPDGNPFSGCAIGVFMEYNVPSGLAADASVQNIRTFDPAKPDHPCPALPERFQRPCYHQLPQWWEKVMAGDYARIGRLCAAVTDAAVREACFRGIGNVAGPSSGYNVAETVRRCREIPDQTGEVICRQTAAGGFYSVPAYRQRAPALCAGMGGEGERDCAMLATGANGT